MSVSGSDPIRVACRFRPSVSRTMMRSAPSTTWWLVRIRPSASMMNPVPAPRRGPCGSRSPGRSNSSGPSGTGRPPNRRLRAVPRDVASMFTTAGLSRSATSAKDTTVGDRPGARRARAGIWGALGAEIANCGVIEPATTRPIRNAMVAVRQTVTTTNRRVMDPIITLLDQVEEARLIQQGNPRRSRLLGFGARLGPHDYARSFLTDRPGDFRAKALERSRGLFPRHGRQRAGDHVGPPRQPARRGRGTALVLRHLHIHASSAQTVDELPVARLVQPAANRFGQHGSDLLRLLQLLDRRGTQCVHRPERLRHNLGRALTDV